MNYRILAIAALGLLLTMQESRAALDQTTPEDADAFYQQGNCHKALRAYWMIQQSYKAPDELRELAEFRTGYCLLQISRPREAAESFALFLKHQPDNDEARLRYAQALIQSQDARGALYNALQVEDGPFLSEATLLAAQAELEMGRVEDAEERLSHARVNNDWRPAFTYWIAVAKFRQFDYQAAKTYFLYASSIAPPNHWVRQEVLPWIDRIRQEDVSWHGSAVLGYFTDSNVAQESIITTDSSGNPTQTAPVPGSYYNDAGYYAGFELDYRIRQTPKWTLSAFGSLSSSFYQTYTSYSAQSLSAGAIGTYRVGSQSSLGLTAKYLDSRYAYDYYQDYAILDPNLTLGITDRLSFYLETPYTLYLFTRQYHTFGVSLSARYQFSGWKLFLGANYLRARGAQASFYASGGLAYVSTGEMFVNYESSSRFVGGTVDLPWSFYTTAQLTSSSTHYDSEALPAGTLEYGSSDRQDSQIIYGLELGRVMMPGVWNISLAFNHTQNASSGLQGLAYDNEQANYNYNRNYLMLKTTLTF